MQETLMPNPKNTQYLLGFIPINALTKTTTIEYQYFVQIYYVFELYHTKSYLQKLDHTIHRIFIL